jgi:FkbM family methyltransferase
MADEETVCVRVVAKDSQARLISDAIGRDRLLRRRARMQALGRPRLAIIPDDEIGIEILQFGIYEERLLSMLFDDVLAPYRADFAGKMALDIGANIGNHSVYLAQQFKRVISFEPGSVAYHLLCANRILNKSYNIEPHQIGLSDQDAQASLVQVQLDNIGSNAVSADAGTGSETIKLCRGDDLLKSLASPEQIALEKIDVEGHEIEALRGLESTLRAQRPIILFETTGKQGPSGSVAILDLLRSFGYLNFYTLAKDFPFPQWRSPLIRAAIRAAMGARYVLTKRESFDDRYYNLAIATVDQQLA